MKYYFFVFCFLIGIIFLACEKDDSDIMESPEYEAVSLFELPAEPFQFLSDYGFFIGDMGDIEPHPTLIPYTLPTGLFSNYSSKQRLVYMPPGKKATYVDDDQLALEFPDSTVIIKTFFYENDFTDITAGKRIIETRLLIKRAGKWEQAEYIWNDEQTDAKYTIAGGIVNVNWIHYDGQERSTIYAIPNLNECKGCHELGEKQVLIGPKARYLNSDHDYGFNTMNQLERWLEIERLDRIPAGVIPKAARFDDATASIEDRARTYLDINCAHCHNDEGPANNSGLFLDFNQDNDLRLGICKSPVAAGGGSGGLNFSIVPGAPEESIMIYRLNSLEPDVSMPELGRSVVHEEGLQLLKDWIAELDGECN